MQTYEGTCLYCGATEIIMAESQEEADDEVTRLCRCGGKEKQERRFRLQNAVWGIAQEDKERNFRDVNGILQLLNEAAYAVMDRKIEKAQFTVAETTITLASSGGKVKVTRAAKTLAEEEA